MVKPKRRAFLIGGIAVLATTLIIPPQASAAKRIVFGGGPAGGTFQVVANAIQVYDIQAMMVAGRTRSFLSRTRTRIGPLTMTSRNRVNRERGHPLGCSAW